LFTGGAEASKSSAPNLCLSEHHFDIVAIWVENERGIVAGRKAARSQAGLAIVSPAYEKRGLMEGINLLPALSAKSSVLLNAMGVENINPERRIVNTVCHSAQVHARVFCWPKVSTDTHDDFDPQRVQRGFIEPRRSMNIRYPDSGVVDEPIAVVCHLVSLVTSGGPCPAPAPTPPGCGGYGGARL
jgi:hypothetical protein